ncbi:hypothetical protein [Azospirillum baldaniorum]|uniref:hypothetical protein n=1 Tax=Azospirillum baldaniorum TaxID=1064539 RepID=UPI001013D3C1|nr:hypothetical protein [Azospirillum baldaniorum]
MNSSTKVASFIFIHKEDVGKRKASWWVCLAASSIVAGVASPALAQQLPAQLPSGAEPRPEAPRPVMPLPSVPVVR